MFKKMFKLIEDSKNYDLKKRLLINTSILFLVGFIPVFTFFLFGFIMSDFDLHISVLQFFYYSLLFGFIGILIGLIYSHAYKYKFSEGLVYAFIIISSISYFFILIAIIMVWIISSGTFG